MKARAMQTRKMLSLNYFPRTRKCKQFPSQIKVLYVNANGIGDKMASLETAAHIYDAHIIAISDTKQLPPIAKGYGKWKSKERKNRAEGGVAIEVRQNLAGWTSHVEGLDEEDQEIVWIEIGNNNKEKLYKDIPWEAGECNSWRCWTRIHTN